MTARPKLHDARALRFLVLCLGGWTALRAMAHWSPTPALPLADPVWRAPTAAPIVGTAGGLAVTQRSGFTVPRIGDSAVQPQAPLRVKLSAAPANARKSAGSSPYQGRHGLRFAMAAPRPPTPTDGEHEAMPAARPDGPWSAKPIITGTTGTVGSAGRAFWMKRDLRGWSVGTWLYLRQGSATPSTLLASQLGGSQAGARLSYGFGNSGRVRPYGRVTVAAERWQQREVAVGLAVAPMARWPVDVAVEHRIAVGREGRTALAVVLSGGVSDVALPGRFKLEAYGQTGIVGARRRDAFADTLVIADHALGAERGPLQLRVGALVSGAVQPGAARVDVGPRITLRLPEVGRGSRIALDWRQKVAGDAQPSSGLALTLATDF